MNQWNWKVKVKRTILIVLSQHIFVKEGEYKSFLETYEQDLVDDGWEVTLDEKPDFLILTKEEKEIKIMSVQLDDEIKVFRVSVKDINHRFKWLVFFILLLLLHMQISIIYFWVNYS